MTQITVQKDSGASMEEAEVVISAEAKIHGYRITAKSFQIRGECRK
jgi:hypothetical protein